MADNTETASLDCYLVPAKPMPMLLPAECIAEVIAEPEIDALDDAPANWMVGHVTWRNQRLPVMSYSALHIPDLDESRRRKKRLVVLNPIPNAARKAYSGILCFGDVKQVSVDESVSLVDAPEKLDKRYAEAVVKVGRAQCVLPKLSALGVAFSYF